MAGLPQETIDLGIIYAKLSQAFATYDEANYKALRGFWIQPKLSLLLRSTRKALEWAQQYYLGEPELDKLYNFMYALCGPYILRSQQQMNAGGIGIIPNPMNIQPLNIGTIRLQFTIEDDYYPLTDDGTIYTITDSNILMNSLMVGVVNSMELPILPLGDVSQFAYSPSYTTDGVVITFNTSVAPGTELIVRYWKLLSTGSSTIPGSGLPVQLGNDGKALYTTGTEAKWKPPFIHITSADFEPDGITYLNSDLDNARIMAMWTDVQKTWYNGNGITYISGGGFVVTDESFNANTDIYNIIIFITGINNA